MDAIPDFLKDAQLFGVTMTLVLPFVAQLLKWIAVKINLNIGGGQLHALAVVVVTILALVTGAMPADSALLAGMISWAMGIGVFELASRAEIMPAVKRETQVKDATINLAETTNASVGKDMTGGIQATGNVRAGGDIAGRDIEKQQE